MSKWAVYKYKMEGTITAPTEKSARRMLRHMTDGVDKVKLEKIE